MTNKTTNKNNVLKLISTTALSLVFATSVLSPSAQASNAGNAFCDLSTRPDIRSYENPKLAAMIEGRYDSTGRTWWWDVAMAPTCALLGFCAVWYAEEGPVSKRVHYTSGDDQYTTTKEYTRLQRECRDFIRKNLSGDILFDGGAELIAEHYFCSNPTAAAVDGAPYGGGYQYSISVMYGNPVYGNKKTPEEIHTGKCEKLQGCYERAKTPAQMTEVTNLNQLLGCF